MKKLFLYTLIVCGLSIAFFDDPAAHILSAAQALTYYRVVRTLTDAGEGGHFFAIAILGMLLPWLYLKLNKNTAHALKQKITQIKNWNLFFLYALLGCGAVVHISKFIFGRQRPHKSETYDHLVFEPFNMDWHFHSFPSGHSQTLFTAATVAALAWPKYRVFFFVTVFALAFTRVLLHAHFLSDVFMGAFIGYAVTQLIYERMKSKLQ